MALVLLVKVPSLPLLSFFFLCFCFRICTCQSVLLLNMNRLGGATRPYLESRIILMLTRLLHRTFILFSSYYMKSLRPTTPANGCHGSTCAQRRCQLYTRGLCRGPSLLNPNTFFYTNTTNGRTRPPGRLSFSVGRVGVPSAMDSFSMLCCKERKEKTNLLLVVVVSAAERPFFFWMNDMG
ncbi:hypothetical protein F5148DRAFT_847419 [Russula earlei]|uniref:Uncharacterized protein n=1 Tax=Russula earlei TaxID=71964 RepID=A0ACC0TT98_9AGAM|nr:hypothetical protein F5148DRAFT_847419 [Russula earlei]